MSIGGLNLESPLFYNNEFGLRFEIGLPTINTWSESRTELNTVYFDTALNRAISIFQQFFAQGDAIP